MGFTLIEAMLMAPLAAVVPDDTGVIHAVDKIPIREWETAATIPAACGADTKLLPCPWPVPTRHTTSTRCPQCRDIVGTQPSSTTRRWWAAHDPEPTGIPT